MLNASNEVFIAFSGLLGVAIGALLASFSTHLLKAHEYKREYYKSIISERLDHLKLLNQIVTCLRAVQIDDRSGPYHVVLIQEGKAHEDFMSSLLDGSLNMMWFTKATYGPVDKLFHLVGRVIENSDEHDRGLSSAADHYSEIAIAREKLRKAIADELWGMSNIRKFLREKKKEATIKPAKAFDSSEWKWVD